MSRRLSTRQAGQPAPHRGPTAAIGLVTILALALMLPVRGTTLEQMSLTEMILKSTAIVHAKVTGSYAALRGQDVYTHYQLQVSETLKPAGSLGNQAIDVAVPGGSAQGLRQLVAGAPAIAVGGDYVFFLWTSRSGLTQVIGLSQGLYRMTQDSAGNAIVVRPATTELMLDKTGHAVTDQAQTLEWSEVRTQIRKTLGGN